MLIYVDCACLPNSCFRSGNSLGRVSMIDGCLCHIISKQRIPWSISFILSHMNGYHVLRAASSGALRSWDPGGFQDEIDIYTSSPLHNSPSSIFTLQLQCLETNPRRTNTFQKPSTSFGSTFCVNRSKSSLSSSIHL